MVPVMPDGSNGYLASRVSQSLRDRPSRGPLLALDAINTDRFAPIAGSPKPKRSNCHVHDKREAKEVPRSKAATFGSFEGGVKVVVPSQEDEALLEAHTEIFELEMALSSERSLRAHAEASVAALEMRLKCLLAPSTSRCSHASVQTDPLNVIIAQAAPPTCAHTATETSLPADAKLQAQPTPQPRPAHMNSTPDSAAIRRLRIAASFFIDPSPQPPSPD